MTARRDGDDTGDMLRPATQPAPPPSRRRFFALASAVAVAVAVSAGEVQAQPRDGLLNGALIGAASGAVAGVAFTHAVRDSELTFSQDARGALIFGAIGAGLGLGIDALFNHVSSWPGVAPRRLRFVPAIGRGMAGLAVTWTVRPLPRHTEPR